MSVTVLRRSALLLAMCAASAASVAQSATPAVSRPVGAASAPSTLRAGLWETTIVTEVAFAASRRSVVSRTCVTPEETANPGRFVPQQRTAGMQCENSDVKRDGPNVVWQISCRSPEAVQAGKGRLSLFGESFLGSADIESHKAGSKSVSRIVQSYSGKWLQACS